MMVMDIYGVTHRGKVRSENQDTIFISGTDAPYAALVADGMGGHVGGQVASSKVASFVEQTLQGTDFAAYTVEDLKELLVAAGNEVCEMARRSEALKEMGTTCTIAMVHTNEVRLAHVGDTRAYILKKGVLRQITKDHSYVQYLADKGIITQEETVNHPYKNMITQALGMQKVDADGFVVPFCAGDTLLICSDGLTGNVSDREIEIVLSEDRTAQEKVDALLQLALDRGGQDNISIIVVIRGEEKAYA